MDASLLQQLIAPVLVIIATQGVKKASAININKGNKGKLIAISGVLSFISALVVALANGNLEGFLTPEVIKTGTDGLLTFAITFFGYKAIKKTPVGKAL